jgi:hypothetical protein
MRLKIAVSGVQFPPWPPINQNTGVKKRPIVGWCHFVRTFFSFNVQRIWRQCTVLDSPTGSIAFGAANKTKRYMNHDVKYEVWGRRVRDKIRRVKRQ